METKDVLIVLFAFAFMVASPIATKIVFMTTVGQPCMLTLAQQMALFSISFIYLECISTGDVIKLLNFKAQLKYIVPLAIAEVASLLLLNFGLMSRWPSYVAMVGPLALLVQSVITRILSVGIWKRASFPLAAVLLTGVTISCVNEFEPWSSAAVVGSFVCLGTREALHTKFASHYTFFENHMLVAVTTVPWTLALSFVIFVVNHEPLQDLLYTSRERRVIFLVGAFVTGLSLFLVKLSRQVVLKRFQSIQLASLVCVVGVSWLYFQADRIKYIECAGLLLAFVSGFLLLLVNGGDSTVYVEVDETISQGDGEKIVLGKDTLDSDDDMENGIENGIEVENGDALSFGS